MTNGARVIDSAPPAIASPISSALIARAAAATASMPEAQRRLTVAPGTDVGQTREQKRHAREVAIVLPRLIGAAQEDFVDFIAKAGMTAHELADRRRGEIVGADVG